MISEGELYRKKQKSAEEGKRLWDEMMQERWMLEENHGELKICHVDVGTYSGETCPYCEYRKNLYMKHMKEYYSEKNINET